MRRYSWLAVTSMLLATSLWIHASEEGSVFGKYMWRGRIDSDIDWISAYFRYTPITITPADDNGEVVISNPLTEYNGSYIKSVEEYLTDDDWQSFRAIVDEEEGALTIKDGQTAGVYGDLYPENPELKDVPDGTLIYLFIAEISECADIEKPAGRVYEIIGNRQTGNGIEFGNDRFIGFGDEFAETDWFMKSCSTYSRPNSFEPVVEVVPDMGDYDYVGEATFTDGWFNPRLRALGKDAVQDVKVPLWRSRDDSDMLLLQNPYSDARWIESGLQKGDGDGSILLDVSDTGFVKVVPGIKCGMRTEIKEDGDPVDFYPLTYHQWSLMRGEGSMGADGEPSVLSGDMITIKGAVFGVGDAPLYGDIWVDTPRSNNAQIVLPKGWSGTVEIYADPASAPCYYNLQGVRLPHPVRGQPMIEVTAGHARKVMK